MKIKRLFVINCVEIKSTLGDFRDFSHVWTFAFSYSVFIILYSVSSRISSTVFPSLFLLYLRLFRYGFSLFICTYLR